MNFIGSLNESIIIRDISVLYMRKTIQTTVYVYITFVTYVTDVRTNTTIYIIYIHVYTEDQNFRQMFVCRYLM